MKHLFRCLCAAMCILCLCMTALADVLPFPRAVVSGGIILIILGIALVAVAIIIAIIRRRKK